MAKGGKKQQQQQTKASATEKKAAAAPEEVAAVPGFFGHVIKPGQKLFWANEVEEFCLQINSAALGATVAAGRSTLFVLAKDAKIALCTLIPESNEQFTLSHTFTPLDGEIEFVVEGVNEIHLTGFIDVQEDDDDDEGDRHDFDEDCDSCDGKHQEAGDSDDSMDEDEEMMVFGDQSESDEEDEEGEERFEVIEERVHGDVAAKKAKDEKKPATKKAAAPAKKEVVPVTKEAVAEKETPAPTKKEIAAAAKTEKKIADKVAELTASSTNNKKRPAPSESVDVPKKAKNSRVHKGVTIEETAVGKGPAVLKGRKVSILYKGRLENGKQFDSNTNRKKPFSFRHGIGDVIKGMDIGIEGMRSGGKRTILIPSKLGYGKAGAGPDIPGNANLIFDIELL
ncbi:hypothetical protein Gpo141_00009640 [Globisporangium polare]